MEKEGSRQREEQTQRPWVIGELNFRKGKPQEPQTFGKFSKRRADE